MPACVVCAAWIEGGRTRQKHERERERESKRFYFVVLPPRWSRFEMCENGAGDGVYCTVPAVPTTPQSCRRVILRSCLVCYNSATAVLVMFHGLRFTTAVVAHAITAEFSTLNTRGELADAQARSRKNSRDLCTRP
jgi:hypothetical protein